MSFLCPRCSTPLPYSGGPALREVTRTSCPACGFVVDLALADTAAGRPVVSIVRDYTGKRLGALELEALLGAGGMGTVYRARDTATGERVAVKLMYPQMVAHAELVERFRREAQTLRELKHPGIVAYRDQGEIDGLPYLVMEYLDGKSLEERLRIGPLDSPEALSVAEQICEALRAAHQAGVVHRDLKPANVILSGGGIKVLDFGIAHLNLDDLTLTRSGAVLGTFNYMAPEQRSGGPVDARADLFALGVIMYRMLTGALPVGVFDPPSKLLRGLDGRIDAVVARALQSDLSRRYGSAAHMLADLHRLKAGRRRWVVAAAAAAVVVLGIAATYIALKSDEAPAANPAPAVLLPAPPAADSAPLNPPPGEKQANQVATPNGPPVVRETKDATSQQQEAAPPDQFPPKPIPPKKKNPKLAAQKSKKGKKKSRDDSADGSDGFNWVGTKGGSGTAGDELGQGALAPPEAK